MAEKKEKSPKQKKQDGLKFACWLLAFLIVILLFVINWQKISTNVGSLFNEEKSSAQNKTVPKNTESETESETEETENFQIELTTSAEEKQESQDLQESEPIKEEIKTETKTLENPQKSESEKKEIAPKTQNRNITLYFVEIDSDGSIVRKPVTKSVEKTDSPLTDAIKTLLKGTSPSDKFRTLIPEGTKLIGASVKNGIATLNFNEAFVFNQNFGSDGYSAQLQQIVFTATEFSTVNSVQFLIEGEKKDFLVEGLWIGSPLSRANF